MAVTLYSRQTRNSSQKGVTMSQPTANEQTRLMLLVRYWTRIVTGSRGYNSAFAQGVF
jgi:hypothetical protein